MVTRAKPAVRVRQEPDADLVLAAAVAARVRAVRVRAGLRQEDVAERSGVARPNVARLERGRALPSLATLRRVAEALEVSIASLLAEPVSQPDADDDDLAEAGLGDFADALDREDRSA